MKTLARNNSIDILRLAACIFIIFLHIQYGHANETFVGIARLTCRWGVPFFFFSSGYFFQKGLEKAPLKNFRKTFSKIFFITIVANLTYFHFKNHLTILDYLLIGNAFHLWFLHSMLIGVAVIFLLHTLKARRQISFALTIFIIVSILLTGSYSFILKIIPESSLSIYMRSFMSIPLMLIGTYFQSEKTFIKLFDLRIGLVFTIGGFLLQMIEAYWISFYVHVSMLEQQFLVGTIFFSMGVFILANTVILKNEIVGLWGIEYSLFIYLYHPKLMAMYKSTHYEQYLNNVTIIPLSLVVFVITLLLAILLNKYLHRVYLLAIGSIKSAFNFNPSHLKENNIQN